MYLIIFAAECRKKTPIKSWLFYNL